MEDFEVVPLAGVHPEIGKFGGKLADSASSASCEMSMGE